MYESHRHYVTLKKPDINSMWKFFHLCEVPKQEKNNLLLISRPVIYCRGLVTGHKHVFSDASDI